MKTFQALRQCEKCRIVRHYAATSTSVAEQFCMFYCKNCDHCNRDHNQNKDTFLLCRDFQIVNDTALSRQEVLE